jgi:hypothetical protein
MERKEQKEFWKEQWLQVSFMKGIKVYNEETRLTEIHPKTSTMRHITKTER